MEFDIKEIQEQFNKVILHSQDYPEVKTDKLFEKWYENKKWFIEANDGKLIFEFPERVSFDLDEDEKMRRVGAFIEEISSYNVKLARFLSYFRHDFYKNSTTEDYSITDEKKVPKGMKISRAIKFFEEDSFLLDKWQTKMSMMLQEDKVTGTLCISVHPLDFLSSSENTYNWRSCHALDGEYRAGNLSYMLDEATVICYLKGDKDAVLPRFPADLPWNNKKWRMLLFFSDSKTMLFAGRQYPFFNRNALDIIFEGLRKNFFISKYGWMPTWTNKLIKTVEMDGVDRYGDPIVEYLHTPYVVINGSLIGLDDLITDAPHSLHFNDLTKSSCYTPYYIWKDRYRGTEHFTIGSAVPCLYCEEEYVNITGSFLCDDHELEFGHCEDEDVFCYCAHCGERLFVEADSTYLLQSGEYVCESCFDRHCGECSCCGDYVWNSELHYNAEKDKYECEGCNW